MKVYDKPDETVARFWVREGYPGIYDANWATLDASGRWLPVTIPEFPKREKAQFRLCVADHGGKQRQFVWCANAFANGTNFRCDDGTWCRPSDISFIRWLTPEYLDELTKEQA